jgi:hypothetical protein
MSAANGHANGSASNGPTGTDSAIPAAALPVIAMSPQFTAERLKNLVVALEVPFDPSVIEWRITNTTKNGSLRGQIVPYADPRAYTDRLNALLTPAGWTRKYAVQTSANFQRGKDQKTVAKVFVTCELIVFGIGSHSATGEEWTDDDNAGTSAEAQAFKRACCCFGLGRYLYYFTGAWVDLDERKRPKTIPKLFGWATPDGWRNGMRPPQGEAASSEAAPQPKAKDGNPVSGNGNAAAHATLIAHIEAMAEPLGRGLYRGLLKTVARAWKPIQIRDVALLQKVLEHMQAAERGLRRLETAIDKIGPESLVPILHSLKLNSLEQVDNLKTLHEIVVAMEAKAGLRANRT